MLSSFNGLESLGSLAEFKNCYLDSVRLAESRFLFKCDFDEDAIQRAFNIFVDNFGLLVRVDYDALSFSRDITCVLMYALCCNNISKFNYFIKRESNVESLMNGVVIEYTNSIISLVFALHVYGYLIALLEDKELLPLPQKLYGIVSVRDVKRCVKIMDENSTAIATRRAAPRLSRFYPILRTFRKYDALGFSLSK